MCQWGRVVNYEPNSVLRRTPRQARGQRKVEHILRSAEALFAEVGFEQATTNAIASRAGISIGSLYQFFSSKETILAAIADRYLEQMRLGLGKIMDSPEQVELPVLLTRYMEMVVKLQDQRPYFLQCLSRYRPSPALNEPVAKLVDALSSQWENLLQRATGETDPKLLRLRSRVCTEAVGCLLALAVRAHGRDRVLAIREIVTMLTRYLEPTLKVRGEV